MHDHSTNPRHSLPIPSALLPPSIHKPLKPQHPSSLVSIPGLKLTAPPRLAPHHATPFFPWIQKLSCLPPSPLKAPLQAPLSSFPILPSWASCTPPINLDHACLLRSHFLLDPSTALTPESLASSSHPSALPLNQWTTIDGPFTSDRDDAIKITPSSIHVAIPIPSYIHKHPSWLIPSSIYLPLHAQHLSPNAAPLSLTAGRLHQCLILNLVIKNNSLSPSWSVESIPIQYNSTYDHIDSLIASNPSQWAHILPLFPPSPLSPNPSKSATLIEALMTITNHWAAHCLQKNHTLFWKTTTSPIPDTITPLSIPQTAYSSTPPTNPWPLCFQPWIQLLPTSHSNLYLQITSPLRRLTDAYNISALAHQINPSHVPPPPQLPPALSDTLLNASSKHIRNTQNFASFQHCAALWHPLTQSPTLATLTPLASPDPKTSMLKTKISTAESSAPPIVVNIPLKAIPQNALPPLSNLTPHTLPIQWRAEVPCPHANPSSHFLLSFGSNPFSLHSL